MSELKNRTKRNTGWFKLGHIFIDVYAKHIGAIAVAIYASLKSHANKARIAFPSHELIAEELNISTRTVIRHIKILEAHGFIKKRKVRHRGIWLHNTYFLTQSNEWLTQTSPCDKRGKNLVTYSHLKKNHIKNNSP